MYRCNRSKIADGLLGGESKNLDVRTVGILDIDGRCSIAVSLRFAVRFGITKNGNVRGMLFRNDKSQTDIAKFEQGPRGVLINNSAFEMRGIPAYRFGDITDADGDMVECIEAGLGRRLLHAVDSLLKKSCPSILTEVQ